MKSSFIKSAKLLIVLNLCLTFSFLVWQGCQAATSRYFLHKSTSRLLDNVTGSEQLLLNSALPEVARSKLIRHHERFLSLSQSSRDELYDFANTLKNEAPLTPSLLLKQVFFSLAWELSPFLQAWIFFSLVLSLLCLNHKEGAREALIILPLILLAHFLLTPLDYLEPKNDPYPDEASLLQQYFMAYPEENGSVTTDLLVNAWHFYLAKNWSTNTSLSADDLKPKLSQVAEEGEFYFNLDRLKYRMHSLQATEQAKSITLSFFPRLLLLLWSSFFFLSLQLSRPLLIHDA